MKHSQLFLALLIGTSFLPSSCKKDESQIPKVPVDIYLYASDPYFTNLNAVGGWIYLTGGSRGILVYRKSTNEFMAYDRHCPYQPQETCALVEVDVSNLICFDYCCGSRFLITDGSVQQGPAFQPLKRYAAAWDGNLLHIYNP